MNENVKKHFVMFAVAIAVTACGKKETIEGTVDYDTIETTAPVFHEAENKDAVIEKSSNEKDIIEEKLKARARRDWPNDYTTQEYWVNEELEAYDYMLTIEDNPIKQQAQRDWPLDFSTQKYWYNEQVEARERMN